MKPRKPHLYPQHQNDLQPIAGDRVGVPSARDIGSVVVAFDTGEWVKKRPEQLAVYFSSPTTGTPLLCFERQLRCSTGFRRTEKLLQPGRYRPSGKAFAVNLSSPDHVNAMSTALYSMRDFHYFRDATLRELGRVPQPWIDGDPAVEGVDLVRVEVGSFGMTDEEGRDPYAVFLVVKAIPARSDKDGLAASKWNYRIGYEGQFKSSAHQVRFLGGAVDLTVRDRSLPSFIAAVTKTLKNADHVVTRSRYRPGRLAKKVFAAEHRRRRSVIRRVAKFGAGVLRKTFMDERSNAAMRGLALRRLAWRSGRLVRPLLLDLKELTGRPNRSAAWVSREESRLLSKRSFKRKSSKAEDVALFGLRKSYVKRLVAYASGRIKWQKTWDVSQEVADRDLARLKIKCAALWSLMLSAFALAVLGARRQATVKPTPPAVLDRSGERRKATRDRSACKSARAPPNST